jgi:hypothetical protein
VLVLLLPFVQQMVVEGVEVFLVAWPLLVSHPLRFLLLLPISMFVVSSTPLPPRPLRECRDHGILNAAAS